VSEAPPEEAPALSPEPPAARRGFIGPFTKRQLAGVLGVVVVAAFVLVVVTRPIARGPDAGPPTALPGATPFLVGQAKVGLQPGDLAPELQWTNADGSPGVLKDLDGNPVRLEDLRGKLVWLNFWASWCPPCQSETPVLRDMAERYADDGLAVVGVAVQETTVDDVKAYADRYELPFTIAFDATADAFNAYKVYALPTQVFIAPDGRVVEVVNGPMTDAAATARMHAWLPDAAPSANGQVPHPQANSASMSARIASGPVVGG
jgi:thiol-disulfide isomerase/thioredoxin